MSPDVLLLLDSELTVVDDNGVLRQSLGPTACEPLDVRSWPELGDAVAAARTAPPGWVEQGPVRLPRPDGSSLTLLVATNNLLDDPDLGVLAVQGRVLPDQSPASLPDSTSLLRQVVDNTPVALITLDQAGVVRFAAGAALTVPPDQLVGRTLVDLTESPEQVDNIQRALGGEDVEAVAFWGGRHWQARHRPLSQDGFVTGVACLYVDITPQVVAERARAADEQRLRTVLETASEAIVVVDADGCITWANAASAALFDEPVLPGMSVRDLLDDEAAAVVEQRFRARASGEHDRYEVRLRRQDGELVWLLVSASPMLSDSGEFLGSVSVLTDITEHKAAERRLAAVALTDPVTGAANRLTLADRLQHALQRRAGGLVAVLFLDVDNLKATNDTLGHAAGDDALRHVVARAAGALRPEDTIARYGGDEFVVVCEELHDLAEAVALAERVRVAITAPISLQGKDITTTVSIGVATSPPLTDPDELVAAADAASYAAKRAGRNTVEVAG